MTERELRKLSRQDLLQLLLSQSKEFARYKSSAEELKAALEQERELTDQLKAKLDEKEEIIETLRQRLDAKDETMDKLRSDADMLRTRVDEKNFALEAARARIERLTFGRDYSLTAENMNSEEETMPENLDATEKLRRLKEQLAQSEALADRLRKASK